MNPVVAVVFGYFLAGEGLGLRTIPGTLSVLISVLVIVTTRVKKPVPTLALTAAALGECRDCHPWTISAHRRN